MGRSQTFMGVFKCINEHGQWWWRQGLAPLQLSYHSSWKNVPRMYEGNWGGGSLQQFHKLLYNYFTYPSIMIASFFLLCFIRFCRKVKLPTNLVLTIGKTTIILSPV